MSDTITYKVLTSKGSRQSDDKTAVGTMQVQNSSSFTGANYTVVLGPVDVSFYQNMAVTLVNHHTNKIESGSLEFSPDGTWYEVWDKTTFSGLSGSDYALSMQISSNSRKYFRIRCIPSGSGGALSGSIDAYLHCNV